MAYTTTVSEPPHWVNRAASPMVMPPEGSLSRQGGKNLSMNISIRRKREEMPKNCFLILRNGHVSRPASSSLVTPPRPRAASRKPSCLPLTLQNQTTRAASTHCLDLHPGWISPQAHSTVLPNAQGYSLTPSHLVFVFLCIGATPVVDTLLFRPV